MMARKYFEYHWIVVFPSGSALAAGAIGESLEIRKRGSGGLFPRDEPRNVLCMVVALPALAHPGYSLGRKFTRVCECLADSSRWKGFYAAFDSADYSFTAPRKVADYIRQTTRPDDTVLAWGFDVEINILSDRRSPTRFVTTLPLSAAGSRFKGLWRAEFMADLKRRLPAVIVVSERPDLVNLVGKTPFEALQDFSEFRGFLKTQYIFEKKHVSYQIWRRASYGH